MQTKPKSCQTKAAPAVEFDASLAAQLTAAAPTASLIATIAAQLSASAPQAAPDALVRRAIELYKAAQRALETRPFKNWTLVALAAKEEADTNRVRIPLRGKRFPMTWAQFVRGLLPTYKGRTGEQAALYRAWLRHELTLQRYFDPAQGEVPKDFAACAPTQDEVNRVFGQHRKEGIPTPAEYLDRAARFLRWFETEHHQALKAIRAAAGRKGGHVGKGRAKQPPEKS